MLWIESFCLHGIPTVEFRLGFNSQHRGKLLGQPQPGIPP